MVEVLSDLNVFFVLDFDELKKQLNCLRCCEPHVDRTSAFERLMSTARFIASYYLDLPILTPRHQNNSPLSSVSPENLPITLPNLYEWPANTDEIDYQLYDEVERFKVGTMLSVNFPQCTPQLPVVLLWRLSNCIEAIFYVDHFCDFKSQIMLRFITDHMYKLDLIGSYCVSLLDNTFDELDAWSKQQRMMIDMKTVKELKTKWEAIVNGFLEIDSITKIRFVPYLCERLLTEMKQIFVKMSPIVPDSIKLPRPAVYSLKMASASSISILLDDKVDSVDAAERADYLRVHVLQHAFITLLRQCNVILNCIDRISSKLTTTKLAQTDTILNVNANNDNDNKDKSDFPSFPNGHRYLGFDGERISSGYWNEIFADFLLLSLRFMLRDSCSASQRRRQLISSTSATQNSTSASVTTPVTEKLRNYQALLALDYAHRCSIETGLVEWINRYADFRDIEHMCALFDYLRTEFARSGKDTDDVSDGFNRFEEQLPDIGKPQIPPSVLSRAEFLAEHWSYPVTAYSDKQHHLIGMALRLKAKFFVNSRSTTENNLFDANRESPLKLSSARRATFKQPLNSATIMRRSLISENETVFGKALAQDDYFLMSHKPKTTDDRLITMDAFGGLYQRKGHRQTIASAKKLLKQRRKVLSAPAEQHQFISTPTTTSMEAKLSDEINWLERKVSNLCEYIKSSRRSARRMSHSQNELRGSAKSSGISNESGILVDSEADIRETENAEAIRLNKVVDSTDLLEYDNAERFSLDSKRASPERPAQIEPLNFGLLTPPPDIRRRARQSPGSEKAKRQVYSPPDTGFSEAEAEENNAQGDLIPAWLRLVPTQEQSQRQKTIQFCWPIDRTLSSSHRNGTQQ
ncbi:unnamed protein product [Anisakis simplex]|uniref:WASH complex subunit strumpellin n=1 Tax=Anisakis simplex TaxID=6269 RepID=A0A158PPQ5_ANISI|nr:unnamed protein product [Anisakis simplex]